MLIKSTSVRPQVGQDINSIPPLYKPKFLNISLAHIISFTGSSVKETLIVSPIPLDKIAPIPTADFIEPLYIVPDSVIPK